MSTTSESGRCLQGMTEPIYARLHAPRSIPGRGLLAGMLAVVGLLASATSALALSGSPVKLSEAASYGPPSVAVTESGAAFIAWEDKANVPYTIKYCLLPTGASACAHAGTLTPAGGSNAHIDGVKVLVDEGTIVLLADVYGVGEDYIPEQEWTSTDEGASFAVADEGKSVVDGILSADTQPLNPVILPGTGVLGYAWVTADEPPTFAAFPLSSPTECSIKTGLTCPFATLQPESEYPLTNEHGELASSVGANPGVLGVYETLGKPGCSSGTFDTAYVYGSGAQGPTNSYSISPGSPNSAWRVPLTPADCEVEYVAVDGGPSGLGVLEDNLAAAATVYHRFDQATDAFDTPAVTVAGENEESPAVSQDGFGGVYATYLAGFRGEVRLAYSVNGGASWIGPATLSPAGGEELVSSVDAAGQGWATWQVGEAVYAQPFVAADAVTTPTPTTLTTTQSSGSTTGTSLSITAGTVGEIDHATLSGANVGTATGTVSYTLYSKPTCAASSQISNGTQTVTAGAVPASAPVTAALAPGTYYWQASYSGNASSLSSVGNDPSTSACGSEVLTITPAVAIEGSGSSSGTSVTITVSCPSVEPCTVTITVTATEITIVVKKASAARKKIVHKRTITLATGKFTIPGKSTKKLKLSLTKAGKRLLKREHGHLKANVRVSDKTPGGLELTTRAIAIHTVKPKHKK